ncbi:MAG: AsmA-like C-terminal region-containing protein, partial [Flavobacteriales bacterium]
TIRIDAHLYPDLVPDLAHTTAVADLTVEEGRLARFGPLHAMADFMGDKDLDNVRFGELKNTFTFRDGALHIPEMQINSTLGYMHLSGKQSMDLTMDYTMRVPLGLVKQASWNAVKSKLRGTGRNRDEEQELERADAEIISGQKGALKGYLTVNITGDPDNYKVKLGKSKDQR